MNDSPKLSLDEEKEENNKVIFEEETRISKYLRVFIPKTEKKTSFHTDKALLKGKSLQVYWYLFEHGPAGVREVQRALSYSSPGIITYQIKKLSENGLIVKDNVTGKYSVNLRVKVGLLNFYIKIGPWLLPRFSIYLTGFLIGFVAFFLGTFVWGDPFITNPGSLLLLLFLFLGSLAFIYESRMMWKLKPY